MINEPSFLGVNIVRTYPPISHIISENTALESNVWNGEAGLLEIGPGESQLMGCTGCFPQLSRL
jgi:hypothetical protein